MSKLLKTNQEDHLCLNCKQYYKHRWCKDETKPCFFCTMYLPMRDTIYSILKNIHLLYLKSGEISCKEYYNDFLDNLNKWAINFHVFPTKQDLRTIYELRNI